MHAVSVIQQQRDRAGKQDLASDRTKQLLAVRNSPLPILTGKWAHFRVRMRDAYAEKPSAPLHLCPKGSVTGQESIKFRYFQVDD
jgi:hypothetical protein